MKLSLFRSISALVVLALTTGCDALPQEEASGRIELSPSLAFQFAGDTLELRAIDDRSKMAFGQVDSDGSFKVESLMNGRVVPGAMPGRYQARVVIADDDYSHKDKAKKVIPKKYLSFDSTPLVVEVPSTNNLLFISK